MASTVLTHGSAEPGAALATVLVAIRSGNLNFGNVNRDWYCLDAKDFYCGGTGQLLSADYVP